MIISSDQLQTTLIFVKNLLASRIDQLAAGNKKVLAWHSLLVGFGCFRIERQVATVQAVERKLSQLVSTIEVLRQKVFCDGLLYGKSLKVQNQLQFSEFFYKSLKKDFGSQPMKAVLFFLYQFLSTRQQEHFFENLILYCYGICLPKDNPLCRVVAAGNIEGLSESHFPVPLLLLSPNHSDPLGLTPHLFSLYSRKLARVNYQGLDSEVRPLKKRVRPFKVIELGASIFHFEPSSWTALIKQPQSVKQPQLSVQFGSFSLKLIVKSEGLISSKSEEFRVWASGRRLRIDLNKTNKHGRLGDYSYLYKDQKLYFLDHQNKLMDEVSPVQRCEQTVLRQARIRVQSKAGDESQQTLQCQLKFQHITVKADYLDKLPLDEYCGSPKLYDKATRDYCQVDSRLLGRLGPLNFVREYAPSEQTVRLCKQSETRSAMQFDLVCRAGREASLFALEQVLTVLSIESNYFLRLQTFIRNLREAVQHMKSSGRTLPLDPYSLFPSKMLLYVSTFSKMGIQVLEQQKAVPGDAFNTPKDYKLLQSDSKCSLSSESSVCLLLEDVKKYLVEGGEPEQYRPTTDFKKKKTQNSQNSIQTRKDLLGRFKV